MFDIGPYYITALVSLIGPADKVIGVSKKYFNSRTVKSQPRFGEKITVNTDTHLTGVIEFKNSVTATVITSFDLWDPFLPRMEIYGKEGTLYMPDDDPYGGPDIFGGKVFIRRGKDSDWLGIPEQIPRKEKASPLTEVPLLFDYITNSRGLGLADMVYAIKNERKNRANIEMAYHVVEILSSFGRSSESGRSIKLKSTCEKPIPLKVGVPEYSFDK
jgi:predicted dehydrogenase